MTNQQLMDTGHQMMDETDQAIERSKKVRFSFKFYYVTEQKKVRFSFNFLGFLMLQFLKIVWCTACCLTELPRFLYNNATSLELQSLS